MKPSKISYKAIIPFLKKHLNNDFFSLSGSLCLIIFIAALLWCAGPYLSWENHFPLAPTDKRIYAILFLFLLWLLKLILVDTATPSDLQPPNIATSKKLQQLQSRFSGVLQFLKKTNFPKQEHAIALDQLPWHLLIGFNQAGKTTLLAKSNVQFILQRQFQQKEEESLETSEHCDWWVTKEACILDVPEKYLSLLDLPEQDKKRTHSVLWQNLLHLIKKHRGKKGINSLIVALPFPELMKQQDQKKYLVLQNNLFHNLEILQKIFPFPIPCQFVITKCDLLSGFSEFFSELDKEEITQTWGVPLDKKMNEPIENVFTERFNLLIKRLNQQLIFRLHHERNPMARPFIMDFPLQIERLKELLLDFIKKFSKISPTLSLQGIYLTSAIQNNVKSTLTTLDQLIPESSQIIPFFNEPPLPTHPYFIKQFILHRLPTRLPSAFHPTNFVWKKRAIYATSVSIIGLSALLLGKDFKQGINYSYAIQHHLSNYQLTIQQTEEPNQHLMKTLALLNTLQPSEPIKIDFFHLLSFYSYQSQKKISLVYTQALQTILLPEIKNYFEDYLKLPVNKNAEYVYAALASYLMFGDQSHPDPLFIQNTIQAILPPAFFDAKTTAQLMQHIKQAVHSIKNTLPLDESLIQQTRNFLISRPPLQLSYIILKNMNNNNLESEINLGLNNSNINIFASRQMTSQIPTMFTVKAFPNIIAQEIAQSTLEAMKGNEVLGTNLSVNKETINLLTEQLRTMYVNNYIDVWESLLANIHLLPPKDLLQTDMMIVYLMGNHSPLLQFLQTCYDNTFFEPILSLSSKLQNVGLLLSKKNQSENQLYQILAGLQSLHQSLQNVLTANNTDEAAFEVVSKRMQKNNLDAITQLRLIADKSPEPIKTWLNQITNATWHLLMQQASHYINTAWQEQVIRPYETNIADRYPFNLNTDREVALEKFAEFFGNPGTILNFYSHYLQNFVDTTSSWRLKTLDNEQLSLSDETLKQIEHAMRIHHAFFPYGDNKPYVQFTLQPYHFDQNIAWVKFNINNKQLIDNKETASQTHTLLWPSMNHSQTTSVQVMTADKKTTHHRFAGTWGWFRLVNQSFENVVTKKEILVRFSAEDASAKYLLFVLRQPNPFLSLNLSRFSLPKQLGTDTHVNAKN